MHQCVREIPPNYNRFASTLHQPSKMEISWALDFKDCFFYPSKNSTSWEYFRWIVGCWMCSAFRFFHDLDHFSGLRRTNNSISTNLQPFSSELIRTAGFFGGKMIEEPSFGCFWTHVQRLFRKERGILDRKELTQQMDDFVAWVRPEKISSTT